MAICTKQSIGITLAVVVVGYKLLFVKNKEQFKEYIKVALIRIIGILLPVIIFIIYLMCNNALIDFINYAILGIKTFSNKISYVTLFDSDKIEICVLAAVVPISIIATSIILIIENIMKKENRETLKLLTILVYSLSIIIVMYPISDEIHFLIGGLIAIIGLIYIIFLLSKRVYNRIKIKNKFKIYKLYTSIICIIIFSFILEIGLVNIYNYIKVEKNIEILHYKNIEIADGLVNRINAIDNFILEKEKENKKVYILDAEAAIYMIPINKYNKDYDMFLKGNIGKDGEEGQIEKIKNKSQNEIVLIRKPEFKPNWQSPLDVIDYIRKNLEKIGEISIFEIYE